MLRTARDNEVASPHKNGYRVRDLQAAIEAIEATPTPIKNKIDAQNLKGVGPAIAQTIADFLIGVPPSPPTTLDPSTRRAKLVLQQVPGIGAAKAAQLISEGCLTLSHLRRPEYTQLLTPLQKTNLRFLEHLQQPVSRAEADVVVDFIRSSISSEFEVILAGSFRRGFPISNVLTVLLLHPSYVYVPYPSLPRGNGVVDEDKAKEKAGRRGRVHVPFREKFTKISEKSESLLIGNVIPHLKERGLLAKTMAVGTKKWVGMVRVPEEQDQVEGEGNAVLTRRMRRDKVEKMQGVYRKLEINLVPQKSRSAALLALTGDIEFNRDMRLRAHKMGMWLDEFGLWRWPEAEAEVSLLPTPTESSIFDALGLVYVPPEKRNFSYLVSVGKKRRDRPTRMERVVRGAGE